MEKIKTLSIDIETFSEQNIKKVGAYRYSMDISFEILLFGYAINGGEVIGLDLYSGDKIPKEVVSAIYDTSVIKTAYNAAFEIQCLSQYFKRDIDPHSWIDTQLKIRYLGLPPTLDKACEYVGMASDKAKLKTGKALIKYFSCPCSPTKANGNRTRNLPEHDMEKWKLYIEYNRRDVVAEMELANILISWTIPQWVYDEWAVDTIQNMRGISIDTDLVDGAVYCINKVTTELTDEMQNITGLHNPNSLKQLKEWVASQEPDKDITGLTKADIVSLLKKDLKDTTRRALEIRQKLGKTSVAKWFKLDEATCADGKIRGTLQYYGASRTGREAGRLVQVQNLPRTYIKEQDFVRDLIKNKDIDMIKMCYGDTFDTLSQMIRTTFIPSRGNIFADADYSAIEARVLAWLAGETWVLEVFRTHGKIYEATASQMFNIPIDKIVKGKPEYSYRQQGKVATLALGYQGGKGALTQMDFNNAIPDEDKPGLIKLWRKSNANIVKFWYAIENAAKSSVQTGRTCKVDCPIPIYTALEADIHGLRFLTVSLPSGRKLYYAEPYMGINNFGSDSIHFKGLLNGTMVDQETYGGKLTENVTQAVARDLLLYSIQTLEKENYPVAFHIHDEVVLDIPNSKADLPKIYELMTLAPEWSKGLPLNADGWIGKYFTKD